MNKHKSNKIKENSNTVRHLIMGQITATQNLVAIKKSGAPDNKHVRQSPIIAPGLQYIRKHILEVKEINFCTA